MLANQIKSSPLLYQRNYNLVLTDASIGFICKSYMYAQSTAPHASFSGADLNMAMKAYNKPRFPVPCPI